MNGPEQGPSWEPGLRVSVFVGVLALMILWEVLAPRRPRTVSKTRRWSANFGMAIVGQVLVRLALGAAAVGAAMWATQWEWGVLNRFLLPYRTAIIVSVIVLDAVIYLQHVMFHAVPLFWRLHMAHHFDLDLDVSSGLRFHPFESLLSMAIRIAAVALIGPPVAAVIIFEVVLNAATMFNHGNVRLPLKLDRVLRWFLVTPDMHRVHHSVDKRESNSNFGFILPWWDRILGTYCAQPAAGHDGMTIGLEQYQGQPPHSLWRLLLVPFLKKSNHAINRR